MKKNLLTLLLIGSIGTSCCGYRDYAPVYREVQVKDVMDEQARKEIDRLRRENDRLRRNNHPQVQDVYVRYVQPAFEWLTNSDMIALKYMVFGAILCLLITRKR